MLTVCISTILSFLANLRDKDGYTPLMVAAKRNNLDMIRALAPVTDMSIGDLASSRSAVHIAASTNNIPVLKTLIEVGCDCNLRDVGGNTPLHLACLAGQTESVDVLVGAGADLSISNKATLSPLLVAASRRRTKDLDMTISDYIISNGMRKPLTDAMIDTINDDVSYVMIQSLLKRAGANVNMTSFDGSTALHFAAATGNMAVLSCCLRHNADVNIRDSQGKTVLHILCSRNDVIGVYLVLRYAADRLSKVSVDKLGYTPIHSVIQNMQENDNDANVDKDVLLSIAYHTYCAPQTPVISPPQCHATTKSTPGIKCYCRNAPEADACPWCNVSAAILDGLLDVVGMDANQTTSDTGESCVEMACRLGCKTALSLMAKFNVDPNVANSINKSTALITAVRTGLVSRVQSLLCFGNSLKLGLEDSKCETALMVAQSVTCHDVIVMHESRVVELVSQNKKGGGLVEQSTVIKNTSSLGMIAALLDIGCDVNGRNTKGETCLLHAISKKDLHVIKFYLAYGSDSSISDITGINPLTLANKNKLKDIAEILMPNRQCPKCNKKGPYDRMLVTAPCHKCSAIITLRDGPVVPVKSRGVLSIYSTSSNTPLRDLRSLESQVQVLPASDKSVELARVLDGGAVVLDTLDDVQTDTKITDMVFTGIFRQVPVLVRVTEVSECRQSVLEAATVRHDSLVSILAMFFGESGRSVVVSETSKHGSLRKILTDKKVLV